jgi:hypothetical protein
MQIQNRMLEASMTQQEDYYRKNLQDLNDQQAQEMKLMHERAREAETRFVEAQKQLSEELATLRKEHLELKLLAQKGSTEAGGEQKLTNVEEQLLLLQQENSSLQLKVKELSAEKMAILERLKSIEQLKSLHENDITKVRANTNFLQKMMQDSVRLLACMTYL